MRAQAGGPKPRVSVIMPTRNEAPTVVDAVSSLLRQRADDFELEILVVDGCSSDGSGQILADLARDEPRVRVIENPHRSTPHAMNIGLGAACGSYVGIFGSHSIYDPDYIAVCLEELRRHAAAGCSGRVVVEPAGPSGGAQLAAWTFTSRFASSGKSFRTLREGYADTVPYPVFEKRVLLEIGGYNERLQRNQDNDLNARLGEAGYRLYLTHRTKSVYWAQPGVRALIRYAFRNGFWNALTLRENARALSPRHLVPLVFVAGLLALIVGGVVAIAVVSPPRPWLCLAPAAAVVALHLLAGTITAAQIGFSDRRAMAALLPPVILAFHLSYGMGSLVGVIGGQSPSDLGAGNAQRPA